jgi:putative hydrolase of the HAD superfamily
MLVILDLDDTLVVEDAAHDAAIAETLAAAGSACGCDLGAAAAIVRPMARRLWADAPLTAAERAFTFRATDGLWAPYSGRDRAGLKRFAHGYRLEVWRSALREIDAAVADEPDVQAALARGFAERRPTADRAVPGAPEALHELAERSPVAVLTNGPTELQRGKLARTGLLEPVDTLFTSEDLGEGKPTPAVYEQVLRTMGARPSAAVMVGDDFENDVEGPAAASIKGLHLVLDEPASAWPAILAEVLAFTDRRC